MLLLAGCGATSSQLTGSSSSGSTTTTSTGTATSVTLQGRVKGGQYPVSGATVTLYAASTSGYGGASSVLENTVTTKSDGTFTLTGTYTCTSDQQLYVVATGGNPGSGTNSNLSLMAAIGPCSGVTSSTYININEVTTVASAYALSGFMTDAADVGSSSSNTTGLSNAFATVNNLVNISTGEARSITPAYASNNVAYYNTSIVPQARINALANALAACVNSTGTTSTTDTTSNCGKLFTYTTVNSVKPTDTLQAALNIAQYPGNNVSSIAGLITANVVFQPTLTTTQTSALTDWALPIIYQGAGLGGANSKYPMTTGIAIDADGNIWVPTIGSSTLTTAGGSVAVFNNLGAPISPSGSSSASLGGYTGNGIQNPQSIAIDKYGYAWIGNAPTATSVTTGSVTVIDKSNTAQYGTATTQFTNNVLLIPNLYGIAVDANNTVWVSSNVGSTCFAGSAWGGSIMGLSGSGSSITSSVTTDTYSDNTTCPSYLAVDQDGNLWTYDNGYGSDNPYSFSLVLFSTSDGSVTGGPYSNSNYVMSNSYSNLAIDSSKNGWSIAYPPPYGIAKMLDISGVTDQTTLDGGTYNPTVFNPTGKTDDTTGAPDTMSSVTVDGAGNVWSVGAATGRKIGLFEVNNANTKALSPTMGYISNDGIGLYPLYSAGNTIQLSTAVDSSGNVWVAGGSYNEGTSEGQGGQLTEFVGIGVPAPTPLVAGLLNSNLGEKP
jgi:hypothetical protein